MKLIGPEANLNHVPCLGWSAPITPNVCVNLILQSARCRKAVKHGVKKDFSRLYVLRLGLCVVICERLRALDKSSCESWNEVPLCLTCRPRSRIWCMKRRAEEPRCPSASWSQTLTGYELTLVLCSLSSPSFFFSLSVFLSVVTSMNTPNTSMSLHVDQLVTSTLFQYDISIWSISVLQYHRPTHQHTIKNIIRVKQNDITGSRG